MNYINTNKNSLVDISIKYLSIKKLFVMLHLVMIKTCNEISLNQLHDLAHITLVPCHGWTTWQLWHAFYAASQIPPPVSESPHWTILVQWMSTSKTNQSWPRVTPWSGHYWCSMGRNCSWSHLPMTSIKTTLGMWNYLLLHEMTPLLTLSRSQGSLRNLETTLLHVLSIPGSLGILGQCKSSMAI